MVAFQAVKEDALPSTSEVEEEEECLPEENRSMVVVEREAVEGDPSAVLASTEVAEVVPPFRDVSHDVDDGQLDAEARSNSASAVAPREARPRTVDEVCPLD